MRLDWRRAYGGTQFADNPHGIGATPETFPQGRIHRLPNIEPLQERLTSPRHSAQPASFDALDITWPRRFSRIGKNYDADWLKNGFPGFANDIDWRLFNMADSDQQFPSATLCRPVPPTGYGTCIRRSRCSKGIYRRGAHAASSTGCAAAKRISGNHDAPHHRVVLSPSRTNAVDLPKQPSHQ